MIFKKYVRNINLMSGTFQSIESSPQVTIFHKFSSLSLSYQIKFFLKIDATIVEVIGKGFSDGEKYLASWLGVKNAAGVYRDVACSWEVPLKVPQALRDAYEALGPALKYTDAIPLPRAYQHERQQPIQPHEIKDLCGVERIELLANGV
jgi:hypothetical protein